MPFEINFPMPLTGRITVAYLTEQGGVTPVTIVSSADGFGAHVEWELYGWLGQWMPGNWRICMLLESIGPGQEYSLPSPAATIPLNPGELPPPYTKTFKHDILIPAGTVEPGTYRVVISLTYDLPNGKPGPFAGHANLEYVQIYA